VYTDASLSPAVTTVHIPGDGFALDALLTLPVERRGLAVLAGGGLSCRLPGTRRLATALGEVHVATLQLDLLTREEVAHPRLAFDIGLLAQRMVAATVWLRLHQETAPLPLAAIGAATDAAAVLAASAVQGREFGAVVVFGGRPDLAGEALAAVTAPVLMVVGGLDRENVAANRASLRHLRVSADLEIIPGASQRFDEPGTLATAVHLTTRWVERYLAT